MVSLATNLLSFQLSSFFYIFQHFFLLVHFFYFSGSFFCYLQIGPTLFFLKCLSLRPKTKTWNNVNYQIKIDRSCFRRLEVILRYRGRHQRNSIKFLAKTAKVQTPPTHPSSIFVSFFLCFFSFKGANSIIQPVENLSNMINIPL